MRSEIQTFDALVAALGGEAGAKGISLEDAELGRYFERLRRTEGGFAYVPVAPLRSFYPEQ